MTDLHRKNKPDGLLKSKFLELLSGKALEQKSFMDIAPFLLFVGMCMVFYINNSYKAERCVRHITQLESELKDLRAEYITTKSQLMFHGKQTEVQHLVAVQGLKKSKQPPYIIRRAN